MGAAARVTLRATRWGAATWGSVFGFLVVTTATSYKDTYATAADRANLAATLGINPGLRTLFGPSRAIDTAAGFTAWRCLGLAIIMGGVWGVLAATRALRGEEDAGRWDLVLAGPVTRRHATRAGLLGLGASFAVVWVLSALGCLAAASSADVGAGSALFFAAVLVAPVAVFLSAGAVAAQIGSTRRQAAMIAGGAFGVAYLLRMIADSSAGASWLRWLTPLGWVYETRPLTGNRPLMLVLLFALALVLAAVAVVLAGRRDAGAGLLRERGASRLTPRAIGSPLALAAHLSMPGTVGWLLVAAFGSFVFGLVAKAAADATRNTPGITERLARLGAPSMSVAAYLGVTLLLLGLVVGLVAAGKVSATREEEVSGTLDHLLAQPVGRWRWLVGRVVIAVAELLVLGVAIGAAGWAGTATQSGAPGFAETVVAGVNLVPAALAVLGIGVLCYGVAPRIAAPAAYAVVAWSFLVEFVATIADAPHWLLNLSLLHHVAPAPAVDPRWGAAGVLVGIGAAAALLGLVAFTRRDVVPG